MPSSLLHWTGCGDLVLGAVGVDSRLLLSRVGWTALHTFTASNRVADPSAVTATTDAASNIRTRTISADPGCGSTSITTSPNPSPSLQFSLLPSMVKAGSARPSDTLLSVPPRAEAAGQRSQGTTCLGGHLGHACRKCNSNIIRGFAAGCLSGLGRALSTRVTSEHGGGGGSGDGEAGVREREGGDGGGAAAAAGRRADSTEGDGRSSDGDGGGGHGGAALASIQPRVVMVYTCAKCETRSTKSFSKVSYTRGVVLVRCPGCQNLHLVADHLGWFGEEPFVLHEFLAEQGQNVVRISADDGPKISGSTAAVFSSGEGKEKGSEVAPGTANSSESPGLAARTASAVAAAAGSDGGVFELGSFSQVQGALEAARKVDQARRQRRPQGDAQ